MKVISEILSFIFELYKSIIGNVARSEEDKIEMDKEKKRVIDSYSMNIYQNLASPLLDNNFLDFIKKIRNAITEGKSPIAIKKLIENRKDGEDVGYNYIKNVSNYAIREKSKFLSKKINSTFLYFRKISDTEEWPIKRNYFLRKISSKDKFLKEILSLIDILESENYKIEL